MDAGRDASPSVLFAGLTAPERAAVRARSTVRGLQKGDVLVRQDEPAEALYMVERGRVKLTQLTEAGQEVIVRVAGPGEVFAAIAVLDGRNYPFTAAALEPTEVRRWDRATLRALFREHARFQANVLEIVGAHSREMLDRFRELATEAVPRRLARALLRLASSAAGPDAAVEGVSRQELAEMAGTTLYTVSRTLSEWADEGIVRAGRGRVVIRSLARLRALAEPGAGTTG